MPAELDPTKRPSLDEIMQQRHSDWQQLPEAQRGQLLVEWFQELLETEHGQRIRAALERREDKSHPTNSISKEDLIYARPDLEDKIEALSNDQMWGIADRVGEIIKDEYWSALDSVLNRIFGIESEETDADSSDNDDVPGLL